MIIVVTIWSLLLRAFYVLTASHIIFPCRICSCAYCPVTYFGVVYCDPCARIACCCRCVCWFLLFCNACLLLQLFTAFFPATFGVATSYIPLDVLTSSFLLQCLLLRPVAMRSSHVSSVTFGLVPICRILQAFILRLLYVRSFAMHQSVICIRFHYWRALRHGEWSMLTPMLGGWSKQYLRYHSRQWLAYFEKFRQYLIGQLSETLIYSINLSVVSLQWS